MASAPHVPRAIVHARRELVERLMLDLSAPTVILSKVREAFPETSAWTIWADRRWVERRWRFATDRRMARKRDALLARMERLERRAADGGHFAAAASLQAWQARILGMMKPDGILLAMPAAVGVNTPLPQIADAFVRTFQEQFGERLPEKTVDATVVEPPHTNGKATA